MKRLIYFEVRKNFIRVPIITFFIVFILLDISVIFGEYYQGDRGYSNIMNKNTVSREQWNYYVSMHHQLDGELTSKNVQYIIDENKRLTKLVEDGNYSTDYNQNTNTGYIWGDYFILNQFFYEPIKYMATYSTFIKESVEQAKENVEFYQKYGNSYAESKNSYIMNHYQGRGITVFYESSVWNKLINYNFSDLLILMLMLLGLIPLYHVEKDTGMYELILSNKNGQNDMKVAKYIAAFLYIALLVLTFSIINIISYELTYGLSSGNLPLYAIESYKSTPLNYSVMGFYKLVHGMKFMGLIITAFLLCYISKISPNIIYSYEISVLLLVLGQYSSGFINAVKPYHVMAYVLSPLSLLKGNELFQNLLGMNIGNKFVLSAVVCFSIQFIFMLAFILPTLLQISFEKCKRILEKG